MELQTPADALRFSRRESLVQSGQFVGVEVVQHDADLFCLGVTLVYQLLHLDGEVQFGAALGDRHPAPAGQGFDGYKDVGRSLPFVFVVVALSTARPWWPRDAGLAQELYWLLIEADHWLFRIVDLLVKVEHILHRADEVRPYAGDAPLKVLPGFDFPFFTRTRRTVSSLILGRTLSSTIRSARSCIVHWARPSGGVLQARAL